VLDGQRGVRGELFEQPPPGRVRAAAVDRDVDAQHADERVARGVERRQQDVLGMPGAGVLARRPRRRPACHRARQPMVVPVVEEPQLAPGLAAGQQAAEVLHRRAGAEQCLPDLVRARHRGDLAHVAGLDEVDHSRPEAQLVDHRLRHHLQGLPQVQARGDAPGQLGQQLSGLGVTHPGCPRDLPVRTMQT
jgi:hypothetical protein